MSNEPATWNNLALLAPYGFTQPNGIAGNADTERGDIYTGPIGSRVDAPAMGYYDAAASTNYQTVLRTPSGQGINIMHIDALPLADGALVAAGQEVGTITAATGNYWSTRGHRQKYFSTFPDSTDGIVEVGLYDNPRDAGGRNSGYMDPAGLLSGAPGDTAKAGGGWTAGPAPSTPVPVADWTDPFANGLGSVMDWGKGNPLSDLSLQPGGLAGQQVNKTVSKAVNGPSNLLAMAGAMAARLGLVALFGVAALAVLVLMFKSLLLPKM